MWTACGRLAHRGAAQALAVDRGHFTFLDLGRRLRPGAKGLLERACGKPRHHPADTCSPTQPLSGSQHRLQARRGAGQCTAVDEDAGQARPHRHCLIRSAASRTPIGRLLGSGLRHARLALAPTSDSFTRTFLRRTPRSSLLSLRNRHGFGEGRASSPQPHTQGSYSSVSRDLGWNRAEISGIFSGSRQTIHRVHSKYGLGRWPSAPVDASLRG